MKYLIWKKFLAEKIYMVHMDSYLGFMIEQYLVNYHKIKLETIVLIYKYN